ncbi:MAG: TerD family protein [Pseudomonadota bacterium]|nr:TerD family protein [Pseudomonadota bacterium]
MEFSLEEKPSFVLQEKKPFYFGLGWDCSFDVDLIAVVLTDGKLTGTPDFVYYGNQSHGSGGVQLSDDAQDGGGDDGDDEFAIIDVSKLQPNQSVAIVVNIANGAKEGKNFSQIGNPYVRVCDGSDENSPELRKFTLSKGATKTDVAIEFGRIECVNGDWSFNGTGAALGTNGEVIPIANKYGAGFNPNA